MSLHATSLPRHSHVGRVSHVGLHNVLGPTLSTGARLPRIRCTRPDTVNLVSHVHDVLGPTLSTWSLTYTMYSARHCQLGLSRTRCRAYSARHCRLGRVSHVGPYTMYSARHCQLGLSRTRCTRPDTVNLVPHVHDVLGPTLSTWSLTYTMYSARHCRLGLSRTRCTRPDTLNLVSHVPDTWTASRTLPHALLRCQGSTV